MDKRCGCCGAKYDAKVWALLPFVGIQRFEDDEPPPLEMRNCPCGNTLVRALSFAAEAA